MSKNDALYLVNLKFEFEALGGGSMILRLAVDPIHQTLSGQAQGTIDQGTQHPLSFTASCSGTIHSTGFEKFVIVGSVNGQAGISVAPPAIGTYLSAFGAGFGVDNNWNGHGSFKVGLDNYICKVKSF
jgi:hypothetical protein